MFKRIYDFLKSKGIEVYVIGQHQGLCVKPYVVIKDNGQYSITESNKVGYTVIDLILFVPLSSYARLDLYKTEVKAYMKELDVRPTGIETPPIVDDEKKAYTVSIEYQVYKKL